MKSLAAMAVLPAAVTIPIIPAVHAKAVFYNLGNLPATELSEVQRLNVCTKWEEGTWGTVRIENGNIILGDVNRAQLQKQLPEHWTAEAFLQAVKDDLQEGCLGKKLKFSDE